MKGQPLLRRPLKTQSMKFNNNLKMIIVKIRNDHRIILNVEEIDRTFDEYLEKLSKIGIYLFYFCIQFKIF